MKKKNKKMKKILSVLLIFLTTITFSQVIKVETHEPLKINYVKNDDRLLASSEIYLNKTTVFFFDSNNEKVISFDMSRETFKKVYWILTNYQVENHDLYMVQLNGSKLFIRFTDIRGYKQSHMYLEFADHVLFLPKFNRIQYKRLFEN